ncbi:hypothetical protein SUGI_1205520 [Cryptomeria japonica]|nr:hypothetical protein SUGI_1205520 [Cryptomeria japonica]
MDEAAAKAKSAKKKSKETDVAFYRLQIRETPKNGFLLVSGMVECKDMVSGMKKKCRISGTTEGWIFK